jgi:hypothetical protein
MSRSGFKLCWSNLNRPQAQSFYPVYNAKSQGKQIKQDVGLSPDFVFHPIHFHSPVLGHGGIIDFSKI